MDIHLEALSHLLVEVSHATVRVHIATAVQSDFVSRAIPHQTLPSPDTITFNHLDWNEEVVVVLAAVDDLEARIPWRQRILPPSHFYLIRGAPPMLPLPPMCSRLRLTSWTMTMQGSR